MNSNNISDLKNFLDEKVALYNRPAFLESDPLYIPHLFSEAEDIELSGFLTAIISWGQRKSIINSARKMMLLMDDAPSDFIRNYTDKDLRTFKSFVHRTFNGEDLIYFIACLRNVLNTYGSLQNAFTSERQNHDTGLMISEFRKRFFMWKDPGRSSKHLSDPAKNSAAKRICMFLRWMVRKDNAGCDFGIWNSIEPSELACPLDVHSGRVARKLGLLHRKQNDWKAVQELSAELRHLDPKDPLRYDFALFGLGVFEKF